MTVKHKNRKEDFEVLLNLGSNYNNYPFRFIFYSSPAYGNPSFVVSYIDGVYTNCEKVDATHVLVKFDNHKLPKGILSANKAFFIPDSIMPDGVRRKTSNGVVEFVGEIVGDKTIKAFSADDLIEIETEEDETEDEVEAQSIDEETSTDTETDSSDDDETSEVESVFYLDEKISLKAGDKISVAHVSGTEPNGYAILDEDYEIITQGDEDDVTAEYTALADMDVYVACVGSSANGKYTVKKPNTYYPYNIELTDGNSDAFEISEVSFDLLKDFIKGDKGDPFTYDDFTAAQIADLKKPATDAANELLAKAEAGEFDGKDGVDGSLLYPSLRVDAAGFLIMDVPEEAEDTSFSIDGDGFLCIDYPDLQ